MTPCPLFTHTSRTAIFTRRKKEYRTFAAQLLTAAVHLALRRAVAGSIACARGPDTEHLSGKIDTRSTRRLLLLPGTLGDIKMPGGALSIFLADEYRGHASERASERRFSRNSPNGRCFENSHYPTR